MGARSGVKIHSVAQKQGGESESILSGSAEMAAAVLSPGDVFVNKNIKKVLEYINHFHVSLAHAHSSILKVTAQQHGI